MLARDRLWVLPPFLALAAPGALTLSGLIPDGANGWVMLLQRLLEITFLTVLCRRWLQELSPKPRPFAGIFVRQLGAGLVFWALSTLVLLGGVTSPHMLGLALLALSAPALLACYRYYFYFFPVALGISSPAEMLQVAREYTAAHAYLPFKALLAPFALWLMLLSAIMLPAPDGRFPELGYVSLLLAPLPWVLGSYISLALAIALANETTWLKHDFPPYRQGRLETVALKAPNWLASLVLPRSGAKMLIIGIMLWMANYVRYVQDPPAPQIKIAAIEVVDHETTLTLDAADPRHRFHGFIPVNFALAGESRVLVSQGEPLSAKLEDGTDASYQVPHDREQARLTLKFRTDRTAAEMRDLRDLYLWYLGARLQKLEMKGAAISPTPAPPAAAPAPQAP